MIGRHLAVAALDPGGAAMLAPVLDALDGWTIARSPKTLPGDADVLVIGTCFAPGLELDLVRQARERGVPSIAVIDAWVNYRRRFLASDGTLILPHAVGVVDELMVEEAIADGLPADRLHVVGHPGLDRIAVRAGAWRTSEPKTHRITFFSQPIADMYGRTRGYDELDSLSLLLQLIEMTGRNTEVAIKPHPKEDPSKFKNSGPLVLTDLDAEDAIESSRLVVGMTSLALVQAAVAGRPVLSIQPDLEGEDALVLSRMELAKPVRQLPKGRSEAVRLLSPHPIRHRLPSCWTDGRSVARMLALINEVV